MKLKKYLHMALFIMLFTSSIVAVEFNNVSLNKIGMLPFLIGMYLLLFKEKGKIVIGKQMKVYLLFLSCSCISALMGIVFPILVREEMLSTQLNYIIQVVFIYLPILTIVSSKNNDTYQLVEYFYKYYIYIARFHAIWIILQFVIYTTLDINISSVLYDDILNGITGANWNSFVYGKNIVIRASGLNRDPAFASYIMICGYIFDKNKYIKWIYLICPMLAQSRTGFLVLMLIAVLENINFYKLKKDIKNYMRKSIFFLALALGAVLIINTNEILENQFNSIVGRVLDIFSSGQKDISTLRHVAYPMLAIKAWEELGNIFYIVFGTGPRASGVALYKYVRESGINLFFSAKMQNGVWAIECDFAEILLGYGILGLLFYYNNLIQFIKAKDKRVRTFGMAMIFMGFMYDYSSLSINVIVIIFMLVTMQAKNKKEEKTHENCGNCS